MNQINIKEYINESPNIDDIKIIFQKCNWWKASTSDFETLYSNSVTYVAYNDDIPVGTGRIISDGIIYGLFVDVLIVPEMQRKGIGKLLIKKMLSYCQSKNLKMIKLLSTPKGKELYKSFGFKVRGENEPGMLMFVKDIVL